MNLCVLNRKLGDLLLDSLGQALGRDLPGFGEPACQLADLRPKFKFARFQVFLSLFAVL